MQWLYYVLLGGTIAFPLAWSFEKRVHFYRYWKSLFPSIFLTAVFFLVWDEIFTQQGVWGFNEKYISGIKLFSLPLEEVLFFVIVPYACVFIYDCVGHFLPGRTSGPYTKKITLILGCSLVLIALLNTSRVYTFWNFLLTGLFLLWIGYRNPKWLGKFWITYSYHLIPFFIVNGILTGSFIEDQIVWYNDKENVALRIFTVPIEDTVYSLLLLLMNINYYELFKSKFTE